MKIFFPSWFMCCLYTLMCVFPLLASGEDEPSSPQLQLSLPLGDHMILQRGVDLPIWGTGPANAVITVDFDGQRKTVQSCANGDWFAKLDALEAVKLASPDSVPKGLTMTITADDVGALSTLKVTDLVVGDVWLCAGQSNMAGKLKGKGTYQGELADYPGFRHWTFGTEGGWNVCSPETAGLFNKTAFYFGRDVYRESLIPIGIVVAAVGGSRIEPWLYAKADEPGKHLETFIEPLVGLGLRGMVWYQGESNASKYEEPYGPKLAKLIRDYRDIWGQDDFPFYFVQLPGYGERKNETGNKLGWPALRQDQLETLAVNNTGMAVTIDIGDKSVHPPNKVDTGKRLARLALYHDYGFTQLPPAGPLYKSHLIDGRKVRVTFQYATGLMVAEKQGLGAPEPVDDRPVQCLQLLDKQGVWHPADGQIAGEELVITSKHVAEPVAARYAYFAHPAGPLLYNKAGLPASPFTTERDKDDD